MEVIVLRVGRWHSDEVRAELRCGAIVRKRHSWSCALTCARKPCLRFLIGRQGNATDIGCDRADVSAAGHARSGNRSWAIVASNYSDACSKATRTASKVDTGSESSH